MEQESVDNQKNDTETSEKKTGKKHKFHFRRQKTPLLSALIISVSLFLILLVAVVWTAAKKPLVIKQLIETNISTLVKEILPASEYVCLVYNYQSITQRAYNPGNWLNARNVLIVLDGTIKLGFDCEKIIVRESGSRLVIKMPPVEILAHEQYPERARSYDLSGGGLFPRAIKPQEVLDLLGDSKLEKEDQVSANEGLMEQARDSAESLFKPLLELNPSIRGSYTIVFDWQE
ncbi:MAG: DUF4230 domain-containing protein [Treponema sp.]|nr:DUF4230 domain-containing protein [Treponema sp.]MCL2236867.1 DUF4230 domain-containing protein [Treponema sp.]